VNKNVFFGVVFCIPVVGIGFIDIQFYEGRPEGVPRPPLGQCT